MASRSVGQIRAQNIEEENAHLSMIFVSAFRKLKEFIPHDMCIVLYN